MQQESLISVLSATLKELCSLCSWDTVDLTTVNGIAFNVYPWHEYCALSVRCGTERDEYNSAEWKLYEFARTGESSSFATAAQWYLDGNGGAEAQQRAHRIFCAAAQAMLDNIRALVPDSLCVLLVPRDFGFNRHIELMVFDIDATFGFNYCEYLTACRLTKLSHDAISSTNV